MEPIRACNPQQDELEQLAAEVSYYRSTLRSVLKDIRDDLVRGGLAPSWAGVAETISVVLNNDRSASPSQNQQHHATPAVPEGWRLVPIEPLINMMSHKDHDTRIMAERQLLAALAAPIVQAGPVSTDIAEALDWLDDFVARCNGDDRGSCEAVNKLRAALPTLGGEA